MTTADRCEWLKQTSQIIRAIKGAMKCMIDDWSLSVKRFDSLHITL